MAHIVEVESTPVVLARWADPRGALTAVERSRVAQFRHAADAYDFVAAHLLVRECVAKLLDTAAAQIVIEQHCERCGGPHGRPAVVGETAVHPTWAHSRGHVAAAAADRAVGIDIEVQTTSDLDEALLTRIATVAEARSARTDPDPVAALLRLWVQKEALVKAGAISLDDFASTSLEAVTDYELTILEQRDRPDLAAGLAVKGAP